MTEAEWLASEDPNAMIDHLVRDGKDDHRRVRLFAVACCRRVLYLTTDEEAHKALDAAERFADGLIKRKKLAKRSRKAERLSARLWKRSPEGERDGGRTGVLFAGSAAWCLETPPIYYRRARARVTLLVGWLAGPMHSPAWEAATNDELRAQCQILRDIFGNPFRPAAVDPAALAWECPAVEIARGVYDERAFDRMPVLGDALEKGAAPTPTPSRIAGRTPGTSEAAGCSTPCSGRLEPDGPFPGGSADLRTAPVDETTRTARVILQRPPGVGIRLGCADGPRPARPEPAPGFHLG
jgi:hypothetical protein